jgi:type I restriction enzyme S subunit
MVNGWKERKLVDIAPLQRGFDLPTSSIIVGEYPIVYSNGIGGYHNTSMVKGPGLVTGRSGTIGALHYVEQDYWPHNTTLWVTDFKGNYPKFIYYLCQTIDWKNYSTGSGVPTLNRNDVHDSFLSLPESVNEQRRIAEALSDTDALIVAMEKLIAKKRAIKRGTMQELLMGKRRLPGFEGEWVEKKISEISNTSSGGTPSRSIPTYFIGKIPWVTTSELNDNYIYTSTEKITFDAVGNSSAKLFPKSTVLMAMYGATIGKLGILAVDATTNQACCAFFFNKDTDSLFMYDLLLYHRAEIIELGSGAGQPNISQKIIQELTFNLPPTKLEQIAIAETLSDMDAEIDALTAKLNKLRNIKQGMMSELLTGRIRLTEQGAGATPETPTVSKITELPKPKKKAAVQTGGHNQQFDDAVMIAGIVDAIHSEKFPLGRKKVQKCLYLLRRHQDESTAVFKKKAAGPYADKVRYRGGEPIARSANYITTKTTKSRGTAFARGAEIDKALGYIRNWGKQADIQWVADNLKYRKVDELELLATVDMAICDLTEAGTPVSVASIKHLIAANKEWKAKLKKQTFSDANIARAIRELQTLL